MKRKMWMLAWVLIPAMLIGACTYDVPGDEEIAEDQLASISQWDVDANFAAYNLVAIPDTIYQIVSQGDTAFVKKPITPNSTTNQVLAQVKKSLEDYGYQVKTKSELAGATPDLAVNVVWTKATNTVVYYDWWMYYDYWYWWYWDWYYPYYPYYPNYYISSYSTGNLLMSMTDVKNAPTSKVQRVIWNATVRSILDGTTFSVTEVNTAINDCFAQTPMGGHK